MSHVKLWMTIGGATKNTLIIPFDKCTTLSVYPLKWLRFVAYTIYGQEGYISSSQHGDEIKDYTSDIEARSYYYVSDGKLTFALAGPLAPYLLHR